jgi:formylglycine-generating enzyme required for sulfatase activity
MKTARDGSNYERANLFILLLLALTLGIMPAGCTDRDEKDADHTKAAHGEKTGETANTKNTDTERRTMRKEPFTNSLGMKFVYIPPGTFMMGSPPDEPGRRGGEHGTDERLHEVTLTRGFLMQTTEVTQEQWETLMGDNPSRFKEDGENSPVETVSWNDAQEFIAKLKERENRPYRLPTEAEWEYACRAGSTTRYYFGDDEEALWKYAWYNENSLMHTRFVGRKEPNAWGLYDMIGNVEEWCQDWYKHPYPSGHLTDPEGPPSGKYRVLRGGSYPYIAGACKSASRNQKPPDYRQCNVGFRLAMSAE